MRSTIFTLLFSASALLAFPVFAQTAPSADAQAANAQPQSGPADLCRELLAYAEKKASEPSQAQAGQAPAAAGAPLPRADAQGTGRQGGGSVDQSSSAGTQSQPAAPTTTPATPGAAPEAAASAHATGASSGGAGASPAGSTDSSGQFKLAGDIALQQVRDTVKGGDRQACRDATQKMRRAGGDLPAPLIALAAYEPDPTKRK